ncbi:C40 family peptidase [Pseudarthrobacter sp. NS4]|uniref:C40 family peptidase n=1 Tax=Pseudarthrobacter sp. NS4 TaxID=2973976 RepID=UPI0021636955|nr:C40 family peptidase [Pseudarthrobacter sp. NS4]
MSKAVSANAGTVGRQAAVVAAASGLVLGMGLPANAADTAGVSASTESGSAQTALAVTAAPTATVSFERPVVKTTAAPKIEPVRTQSTAAATRDGSTATTVSTASTAEKAVEAVSSAATSGIAAIAYTGIGRPYVWGGTSPNGWDCSGFTQWVYAQAGISIPRVNAWTAMTPTSTPKPGDLVMQNGGAHVGIYVGNGMMVSALNPSQGTLLHSVAATGSSSFYTMGN